MAGKWQSQREPKAACSACHVYHLPVQATRAFQILTRLLPTAIQGPHRLVILSLPILQKGKQAQRRKRVSPMRHGKCLAELEASVPCTRGGNLSSQSPGCGQPLPALPAGGVVGEGRRVRGGGTGPRHNTRGGVLGIWGSRSFTEVH